MAPRQTDPTQARETRVERLRILAQLESSELDILELLDAPPSALEAADLWDVLLRVPKLGRQGIRTLCESAQVWPHLQLRELTQHQISRLEECMPKRVVFPHD